MLPVQGPAGQGSSRFQKESNPAGACEALYSFTAELSVLASAGA